MKRLIIALFCLLVACTPTNLPTPLSSPVATFSIQSAVNASASGSEIVVPIGNYPEQVVVSKNNLTIRCAIPLQCVAKRFDLWGSNITLEGFKLVGGLSYGIDVRQSNNIVRNVDISGVVYDFGLPRGQGAAVGIAFFGTGHVFDGIYIHDIDQYHVDNLGYTEPHQDCFITWNVPARGGSGSYITIQNVICDMPQSGDTYVSKVFASSGGSHHWTIRNLLSITPLPCLFYDEAHHIDISYSTFIGVGSTQGCKFMKLNSNPAPHDNTISYSIFQGISGTPPFYNYVTGHNNCFWQVANHNPDPGDIFANPLLLPDYHLAPESPCVGMGAFPNVSPPTPIKTSTPSRTPTKTYTPTATLTRTSTPTKTPTSFVIITDTVPPSPTRTPTATASPTFTPVCYPVYVGGKLIGNFCP